jgi:asparagine synthase (glutamine-hydrolysing)
VPAGFLLQRFVRSADAPWVPRHLAWFSNGLPGAVLGRGPWDLAGPVQHDVADVTAAAMAMDYAGPLRERLLVKVDRATMAVSLEARAPFLDSAVTLAARACRGAHVSRWTTKRVLREVARPLLPRFILRRRKRGLSVPLGRWLAGPLRDADHELLPSRRLADAGLVDAHVVEQLRRDHGSGRADHGRALWTLFVLQHWLRHWKLETQT